MYCPKCGVQNIEDARFCRGCGADIALVPQALTGRMPETRDEREHGAVGIAFDQTGRGHRRRGGVPRLDKAISTGFMGLGFVVISILLSFSVMGTGWWFWMMIPGFSMLGGGIAEYVRYKQSRGEEVKLPGLDAKKELPPTPARMSAIPSRNTAELVPQPPSVTENTTRHLDMSTEAPTRHIGKNDE